MSFCYTENLSASYHLAKQIHSNTHKFEWFQNIIGWASCGLHLAHFQHIVLSVLSFSFPKGIIIERRKNECTFCFSHPVNNKATFFSLLMSLCTLPSPHEQSCSLVTHERGLTIAFVYLSTRLAYFKLFNRDCRHSYLP